MKLKSIIPLALAGAALASCGNTKTPASEMAKKELEFKNPIVERTNFDRGTNIITNNVELKGLAVASESESEKYAKINFWERTNTTTNMYAITIENYVGPSKTLKMMDYVVKNINTLDFKYETYSLSNSTVSELQKLEHSGSNKFIQVSTGGTVLDSQIDNIIQKEDSKDLIKYQMNYSVMYELDGKTKINYNHCSIMIYDRIKGLSAEENLIYILTNTDKKTQSSFSVKSYQCENELGEIVSDYTIANVENNELEM